MIVRIVLVLAGAALAAGGAVLGWLNRHVADSLFAPAPGVAPWLLVAAVATVCAGVVLIGTAPFVQTKAGSERSAKALRLREAEREADAYYSERARAADRDWRSGPLPPPAPRSVAPAPVGESVQTNDDAPQLETARAAPAAKAATTPGEATPPARPDDILGGHARPFPSSATLTAQSPAPANRPQPIQQPQAAARGASRPRAANAIGASTPPHDFEQIRAAIRENRLDDADRLMAQERMRLSELGDTANLATAELTMLAGDHAKASGLADNATWLWRLALKRVTDAGAAATPIAQALADRLQTTGA